MVLISLVFCRRHRHNGRDAARNSTILNDLDDSSRRIDLRMHVDKTKVFISENVRNRLQYTVLWADIEVG